ncbi:hypothetical protein [Corynebacterium argentoratense]|uniref:hypothetical protein n=1 Tax=Corynebacterium argentoratense TaxID=42817 RepID=UPI0028D065DD|nr:hypothetical protein [Corynebacterium argentoratense]
MHSRDTLGWRQRHKALTQLVRPDRAQANLDTPQGFAKAACSTMGSSDVEVLLAALAESLNAYVSSGEGKLLLNDAAVTTYALYRSAAGTAG